MDENYENTVPEPADMEILMALGKTALPLTMQVDVESNRYAGEFTLGTNEHGQFECIFTMKRMGAGGEESVYVVKGYGDDPVLRKSSFKLFAKTIRPANKEGELIVDAEPDPSMAKPWCTFEHISRFMSMKTIQSFFERKPLSLKD